MRVGIFGLGAIGTAIASAVDTEHSVYYFNRSPRSSISLQAPDRTFDYPIQLTKAGSAPILDWILVCLKLYHYPAALATLQQLATETTRFALLCNGINTATNLATIAKLDLVLEVIVDCPVQPLTTGGYHQLKPAQLTVTTGEMGREFQMLFNANHLSVQLAEEYDIMAWHKLIFGSSLGVLLVLANQTCLIFRQVYWQARFLELVEEGLAVARAAGIHFPKDTPQQMLSALLAYPPHKGSSMLSDWQAGRPIEWAAKTDAIIEAGKRLGIDTPAHMGVRSQLE